MLEALQEALSARSRLFHQGLWGLESEVEAEEPKE
jgi:hypothetical protein